VKKGPKKKLGLKVGGFPPPTRAKVGGKISPPQIAIFMENFGMKSSDF